MIKSELINRLAERNQHLTQRDIERIVGTIFDEIATALSRGDRVELRGFGAFSVKRRPARTGRNPRTGAAVEVQRSEEHTSELQSLMRISYAVFCLKTKNMIQQNSERKEQEG